MGRLLARVTWRRHWLALVVVGLVAGLVGGATLTAVRGAERSATAWDRLADRTATGDISVFSFQGVSDRQREQLAAIDGVESVVPVSVFAAVPDGFGLQPMFGAAALASPDARLLTTRGVPSVLDGRLADPAAVDEAMANETLAEEIGLEVGDRVSLSSFSPEQLAGLTDDADTPLGGPSPTVEIVGIVKLAVEHTESDPDGNLFLTSAFHHRYAEAIGRLDLAEVFLAPGTDPAAVETAALEAFDNDPRFDIVTRDEASRRIRSSLDFLSAAFWYLAIVLAVVGLVVVSRLVARLAREQDGHATIARELGADRGQRVRAVVGTVLPTALLGAAFSVAVAWLTSPLMSVGLVDEFGLDRSRAVDPLPGVVVATATAAVVVLAAGFHAVRPPGGGSRRRRWSPPLAPVPQLGVRLSLPRRALGLGAVGLAGTVVALVLVASLDRLEDAPELYGFPWDAEIGLAEIGLDDLDADPGVGALASIQHASARMDDIQVPAFGIDPIRGEIGPSLRSGTAPSAPDEVALGATTRARAGVRMGDVIEVTGVEGSATYRVTGEAVVPSSDTESPGDGLVFTIDGLRRIQPAPGPGDIPASALVRYADGPEGEQTRQRHQQTLTYVAESVPPSEVVELVDLRPLALPLITFFVLLAAAVLLPIAASRTPGRRLDLALTAALGLRRNQLRSALGLGAALTALGALALAVPLGVVVGRLLWMLVVDDAGLVADPVVPLRATALVVAVAVGAPVALAVVWGPGPRQRLARELRGR